MHPAYSKPTFCPCARDFPNGSARVDDGASVCYPHKIGSTILLYGKKNTRFPAQAVVGPDWPCMLLTYSFIIVPTYFFLTEVTIGLSWIAFAFGIVSFLAVMVCFTLTACSDPGVFFKSEKPFEDPEDGSWLECSRCEMSRPRHATHCYDCGVCVENLDHHCPWTGKCIGKKNLTTFYYFLGTLLFHITYVVVISLVSVAL